MWTSPSFTPEVGDHPQGFQSKTAIKEKVPTCLPWEERKEKGSSTEK
jgi:hypothetical protein